MKIIRKSEVNKESRPDGRTIQKFISENIDGLAGSYLMLTSEITEGVNEPTHYQTDSTEIFYYLTPGNINIEGEEYSLSEGDVVVLEKGDVHSIQAKSDMKLLVIKIPDLPDKVIVEKE